MKKYLLILILSIGSIFAAKAQDDLPADGTKRQEKIQALYVAYVTQQLNLTPDEAQKFWPLHTQYMKEMDGVEKGLPVLVRDEKYLNIKKKYQDGFIRILGGAPRCERFFTINAEFKRKLIERMNNRKINNQRQGFRRGQ